VQCMPEKDSPNETASADREPKRGRHVPNAAFMPIAIAFADAFLHCRWNTDQAECHRKTLGLHLVRVAEQSVERPHAVCSPAPSIVLL
jgi:hypothetical protein